MCCLKVLWPVSTTLPGANSDEWIGLALCLALCMHPSISPQWANFGPLNAVWLAPHRLAPITKIFCRSCKDKAPQRENAKRGTAQKKAPTSWGSQRSTMPATVKGEPPFTYSRLIFQMSICKQQKKLEKKILDSGHALTGEVKTCSGNSRNLSLQTLAQP